MFTSIGMEILSITSKIIRILIEHTNMKNSLDHYLSILYIRSIRIVSGLKVIAKNVQSPWLDCFIGRTGSGVIFRATKAVNGANG